MQWLEDTGEVHSQLNDGPYARAGLGSISANDKINQPQSHKPEDLFFGKRKKKNDIIRKTI